MAEGHEKLLVVGGWKDSKEENIIKYYFDLFASETVPDGTAPFNFQLSHEIYHFHNVSIGLLVFLILEELRRESSRQKDEPEGKGENRIPRHTPLP